VRYSATAHDAAFFDPVAGLANAIWLMAVITFAVSLLRRHTVPRPLAIGIVVAYACTIPFAQAGGGLLAAGCQLAVAVHFARAASTLASADDTSLRSA
jgi:hypothetical protein